MGDVFIRTCCKLPVNGYYAILKTGPNLFRNQERIDRGTSK
jgi:hypothetical protein